MRITYTTPDEPLLGSGPGSKGGPPAGSEGARVVAPGLFKGWVTAPAKRGGGRAVRDAIAAADPAGLMRIDRELAPLYCPDCPAVYCADHWTKWDVFADDFPGWFEEKRGRCPQGHERMLLD